MESFVREMQRYLGITEAGDRERLLAASGADDYLEKPVYDVEELVKKVRRLLAPA